MKKIKLIFLGLGYNNFNQACINIYDCNNKLIFEGKTYSNEIDLCLEECNVYRIVVISNNIKLVTSFFVNDNSRYKFNLNIRNNPITFILTDFYYENLPIERGELLLWQKQ
ncbi:MAG: hypothetical protein J5970_02515 [Bacilli bacterium]|nr:hypothetical protein [Bacilli bacterium]